MYLSELVLKTHAYEAKGLAYNIKRRMKGRHILFVWFYWIQLVNFLRGSPFSQDTEYFPQNIASLEIYGVCYIYNFVNSRNKHTELYGF
jgi:hypothetical protein